MIDEKQMITAMLWNIELDEPYKDEMTIKEFLDHYTEEGCPKPKEHQEKMSDNMLDKKSWEEFRKNGMLFLTNTLLQFFGYSIVFEYDEDGTLTVYPARTKYRGFSQDCIENGHKHVANYLKNHINELYDETEPYKDGDTE